MNAKLTPREAAKTLLSGVVNDLKDRKKGICCDDVVSHLESLDFEVKPAKAAGHKIITHDGIPSFYSSSLNCGHGKNPKIKLPYITKIIRLLETYENELIEHLEKKNGQSK